MDSAAHPQTEATMTTTTAATVAVTIEGQPSSSKGWGRYRLTGPAGPVLRSRTGNEWVSAPHVADVEPGTALTLTAQVMLRVGPRKREEISTRDYALIATPDAVATIAYIPGSQGIRLAIAGARLAQG